MDDLIMSALAEQGERKKYLDDSVLLLSWIRGSLADLLRDAANGNPAAIKALTDKQTDLGKALIRAFEAEDKFNAWRAKQSGTDVAAEINFDAIREELGCHLARIRECGRPDDVPKKTA